MAFLAPAALLKKPEQGCPSDVLLGDKHFLIVFMKFPPYRSMLSLAHLHNLVGESCAPSPNRFSYSIACFSNYPPDNPMSRGL